MKKNDYCPTDHKGLLQDKEAEAEEEAKDEEEER